MRLTRTIGLFIVLFACINSLTAQKNVIKTRPIRTIFTAAVPVAPVQVNLTYERVIIPKLSAALTVNYGLEQDLSSAVELLDLDEVLGNTSVSSFGISPEVRFYPGLKKTPRGFYIMGEFFYNRTNIGTDYELIYTTDFTLPDNSTYPYDYTNGYRIEGNITTIGGGVGIGSQWLFGDHLSIDILWVGIGIANQGYSFDLDGELVSKDEIIKDIAAGQTTFTEAEVREEFRDAEVPTWQDLDNQFGEDIKETFSSFGVDLESDVRTDGVTVTYDGIAVRPRFLHFAIGFAF